MTNWQEQVDAYKARYAHDRYSPYAPGAKTGYDSLSRRQNLACVLCDGLTGVKSNFAGSEIVPEADGAIVIGCDHDMKSGYRLVKLIPNQAKKGGATISPTSKNGCPRGLISR